MNISLQGAGMIEIIEVCLLGHTLFVEERLKTSFQEFSILKLVI